jgi:hypothetical protein
MGREGIVGVNGLFFHYPERYNQGPKGNLLMRTLQLLILAASILPAQTPARKTTTPPQTSKEPAALVQPKDVDGWGKIKWGMTVAQAKAAYGAIMQDRSGNPIEGVKLVTRLSVDNLTINDMGISVHIETPQDVDRIERVSMTLNVAGKRPNEARAIYETTRNTLTQKYGNPTRIEGRPSGPIAVVTSTVWIFPSTIIDLEWQEVPTGMSGELKFLDLYYIATDKKAMDVL